MRRVYSVSGSRFSGAGFVFYCLGCRVQGCIMSYNEAPYVRSFGLEDLGLARVSSVVRRRSFWIKVVV